MSWVTKTATLSVGNGEMSAKGGWWWGTLSRRKVFTTAKKGDCPVAEGVGDGENGGGKIFGEAMWERGGWGVCALLRRKCSFCPCGI